MAQHRSRVSSSGAREPSRKRRLPHVTAQLPNVQTLWTGLDTYPNTAQGTPRCPQWQDHSAIFMRRSRPYIAGTNLLGKEVPLHMIKDFISNLLARFQSEDEEGQTLVEYGLLLALIAIIVIVALLFLGPLVSDIFSNVGEQLT